MFCSKRLPKGVCIIGLCGSLFLASPAYGQVGSDKDSTMEHQLLPPMIVKVNRYQNLLREYQPTANRTNDLVETRLDVRFDFTKRYLYGKEEVSLQPHFYPTDSLTLDAKGMDIHTVALLRRGQKRPLKYRYDGGALHISLDKTYARGEKYTIYIDYTAKPEELKNTSGSAAITSDKGLYFINPDGSAPYKPTEVWTQGESESNSVWFPTIDKPNQKMKQEISMTVPAQYTTLSNGMLISQKKNADGTRTDTWKMMHPNSPYLVMMAAGPFVVVKDHWKKVPVDYYVEKKYAPYAKSIFGHTPEMIDFYSKILGIPYPWSKYAQIVARDYVSGAMENTTATLHGEFMYQTDRQLRDDNYRNESVIAHELFHHWFGDLVTTESWSNLTLNESFADFSEVLWAEHKYGKDLADQHNYQAMQQYFNYAQAGKDHPLVNFYYQDKEDMFDIITYQKGGRILNMLRNVVGDSAFFHSLQYYLEQHKFKSAEAQELRLAFEHVTGIDLNWFWNEWYYGKGYPKLDIRYQYNDTLQLAKVIIQQNQSGKIFQLPFAIDLYARGKKDRYHEILMDRTDTFTYHYRVKPDLINVDGDKVLLVEKEDHKTVDNFIYQYHHAPLYLDRREAIEACAKIQDSSALAQKLLLDALNDSFQGLRTLTINSLNLKNETLRQNAEPSLKRLLGQDKYSSVRAAALSALAETNPDAYRDVVMQALKDSSLVVESTALGILATIDLEAAYQQAKLLQPSAEAPLTQTICSIMAKKGALSDFPYIEKSLDETGSFAKFDFLPSYLHMLGTTVTDSQKVEAGMHKIERFAQEIGPEYGVYLISLLDNFIKKKQKAADAAVDPQLKTILNAQAKDAGKLMDRLQQQLTP